MSKYNLTPEQTAKIASYHKKWMNIGLNCEECDFEKAKEYARLSYKNAGLECPNEFYITDSPIACAKLAVKLMGKSEHDPLYDQCVYEELNNQVFGSHEAGWLAYYDFLNTELNAEDCQSLEGLIEISKYVGWWAPYDTCVIFQHRHLEIHVDEQMRLHNESGPAVLYRDGVKIWAINGIGLTEQIIMAPETLTVKQIDEERNNDVKSIMINRFGWARYIKESGSDLLDYCDNDVENTKEALYTTKEFGKRLVVTCPTGRIFVLGVPDKITTCKQAQNWLGNVEDKNISKINVIART